MFGAERISADLYHNIGVGMSNPEPDLGRYVVTEQEADRGAFKTPTLRNVAETAPYMHDGSMATLAEVLDFYDRGGEPNPWIDEKMMPLGPSDQEKRGSARVLGESDRRGAGMGRARTPPAESDG